MNVIISSINTLSITSLHQLITLFLNKKQCARLGFNFHKVSSIVPILVELNNMIGIDHIKKTLIKHIIYFISISNQKEQSITPPKLHSIIFGPPGVGKTKFGMLLSQLIVKLGCIKYKQDQHSIGSKILCDNSLIEPSSHQTKYSDKQTIPFVIVNRSDLIAGYVGQTAIKTQNVINKSFGGCLFIDEAYSIGDNNKDSFSNECIDTLNQNLTENADKFICILAGYKDDIINKLLNQNKGLIRRFPFIYEIENYNGTQLFEIFKTIVYNDKCDIDNTITKHFFNTHYKEFPFFGGDLETFYFECKLANSLRLFKLGENRDNIILNINDLNSALTSFINNREIIYPKQPEQELNDLYL